MDRYPQTEIEEAIQEVNELKDNEELFTEDTYKERIIDFKKRQTVVDVYKRQVFVRPS